MGWISELCYCRIDLNPKAPTDPWSKGAHRGLSHMCPGYPFQYFRSEGLNCYLLVLVIHIYYICYMLYTYIPVLDFVCSFVLLQIVDRK